MFRSKCFSSDRERRRDRDKERLTANQESAKQTQEGETREELKRVDAAEGMRKGRTVEQERRFHHLRETSIEGAWLARAFLVGGRLARANF